MKIADFKDLVYEKFLRDRNNGNLVWKTKDGKIIPLKDLEDSHLDNIIDMFERNEEMFDRNMEALASIPEEYLW